MFVSENLIFWGLVVVLIIGPLIDLLVPPFGNRVLLPTYCLFLRLIGWIFTPSGHSRERNTDLSANKL